jgi:hypothetical protein
MSRSRRVLVCGSLSGAVSFGLVWLAGNLPEGVPLPEDVVRYSPGVVFALLLVLPMMTVANGRLFRLLLVAALSTVIYFLMVKLASHIVVEFEKQAVAACGIAGGLGAILTAAVVRALASRQLSLLAVLIGFVTGSLGGALIGQELLTPENEFMMQFLVLAGFVVWQVGVGFALFVVDPMGLDEVAELDRRGPDPLDR